MGNGEWGVGSGGREETKWRSGGVRGKDTLPDGRATDRDGRESGAVEERRELEGLEEREGIGGSTPEIGVKKRRGGRR